ncbi:MAG: anthranilate phosphoribosyltransferase [Candidatus Omnitrophota bacterium]|nr:anthranilate phosphoribosyltransferase [Candidatus Omnitrophota bacterium]
MIKEAIQKLIKGSDLVEKEMALAMEEIMTGQATSIQTAAFLTALCVKGESVAEITAAAQVMRKFATRINVGGKDTLDTCGTGGDYQGTFNISTLAAIVAAAAGARVAKHGNRSASSHCGSADLLEGLGVNINLAPSLVEASLKETGIGFLFAPNFHPLMKQVGLVRKELGFRTIFNILGPLSNPAGATHQILGLFDKKMVKPMAEVLKNLGIKHALVVYGRDGLDEITTTSLTDICEVKDNRIRCFTLNPASLGIKKSKLSDLKCQVNAENIRIAGEVLSGKLGPQRDIVILNAAAALYTAGFTKDIKSAIKIAEEAIDSGLAKKKLNDLREFSQKSG